MLDDLNAASSQKTKPDWYQEIAKYRRSNHRKAIWQLINTFIPYFALWGVMIYTIQHDYSRWITVALAGIAAGFLIRIFIFFHDCCHSSFFATPSANRLLGYISGILTFTPYENWRRSHGIHHATAGDLDRRGVGDVWTMTVEEYLAAPRLKRLGYRLFRNPLVMFGLGPAIIFLIANRFSSKGSKKKERNSVIITNIAILAIIIIASLTIGFWQYLLIQLSIMVFASIMGVWLFYIQHQFEGVYWARHQVWDQLKAALEGSSYYKLPALLQWFTGNIGLHHIHHVNPRIPNYNLQQCFDSISALQAVEPLTILKSLKSLRMNLWDEKQQKLVSFRSLKTGSTQ